MQQLASDGCWTDALLGSLTSGDGQLWAWPALSLAAHVAGLQHRASDGLSKASFVGSLTLGHTQRNPAQVPSLQQVSSLAGFWTSALVLSYVSGDEHVCFAPAPL